MEYYIIIIGECSGCGTSINKYLMNVYSSELVIDLSTPTNAIHRLRFDFKWEFHATLNGREMVTLCK